MFSSSWLALSSSASCCSLSGPVAPSGKAETLPSKPAGYFNDYAGIVDRATVSRLNENLAQFERETSTQIVVAIYRTMQSESSVDDYTQRVAKPGA